jgi:hypothetical protein
MHGREILNKFVAVHKYIIDYNRARLSYKMRRLVSVDIAQISPSANVRSQRYVVYFVYAQVAQPSNYTSEVAKIALCRGRREHTYFYAAFKVGKKTFCVVFVITRAVVARFLARAAYNALFVVYFNNYFSVDFAYDIRLVNRANSNAVVASYALVSLIVNKFSL